MQPATEHVTRSARRSTMCAASRSCEGDRNSDGWEPSRNLLDEDGDDVEDACDELQAIGASDDLVVAPVAKPEGGHQSDGRDRRAQEAAGAGEALSGAVGGSEGCKKARRARLTALTWSSGRAGLTRPVGSSCVVELREGGVDSAAGVELRGRVFDSRLLSHGSGRMRFECIKWMRAIESEKTGQQQAARAPTHTRADG
eukprot:316817-Prymnesium_polylepis.1